MALARASAVPLRACLLAEHILPTGPRAAETDSADAAAADAAEPAGRAAGDRRSTAGAGRAGARATNARASRRRPLNGSSVGAAVARSCRPAAASADGDAPPGLVWVSDDVPGIRRIRKGEGFAYVGANGKRIRAKDLYSVPLLRILQECRKRAEGPALGALPEPLVRFQHLGHGGALAEGLLDDLVAELAHQLLDPVSHLLVVRGQAGGEVQDVSGGLHGLLVVEQAVKIPGADVLDQLAPFADFLFEGLQPGALVRVGLVGELLDVAQQCAEPRAVERGAFAGEAVQEGEDAGRGFGDFVHDLAGLVPPGQEILPGPLVPERLPVGGAAQPRFLAAELLQEGVDVGVELFQRKLRPGSRKRRLQHGDHPWRRAGQRPGGTLGEEFEVPEPGADGVGGGQGGTGHALSFSCRGVWMGQLIRKNCQLQG